MFFLSKKPSLVLNIAPGISMQVYGMRKNKVFIEAVTNHRKPNAPNLKWVKYKVTKALDGHGYKNYTLEYVSSDDMQIAVRGFDVTHRFMYRQKGGK